MLERVSEREFRWTPEADAEPSKHEQSVNWIADDETGVIVRFSQPVSMWKAMAERSRAVEITSSE
jgi:hypothetical protein